MKLLALLLLAGCSRDVQDTAGTAPLAGRTPGRVRYVSKPAKTRNAIPGEGKEIRRLPMSYHVSAM